MHAVLIGGAALLFIAALIHLRRQRRLSRRGPHAAARVARHHEEQAEGGVHYVPVAEFSIEGQRFEARADHQRAKRDSREVVYLNPRRAIFSYDPTTEPPQIPVSVLVYLSLMACLVAALFIWMA